MMASERILSWRRALYKCWGDVFRQEGIQAEREIPDLRPEERLLKLTVHDHRTLYSAYGSGHRQCTDLRVRMSRGPSPNPRLPRKYVLRFRSGIAYEP